MALLRAAAGAATRAPAFASLGSGARRQQHVDGADSSSLPSPLLSLPDAVMAQVLLPRLDMRSALCLEAVCARLRRSVGAASRASVDLDASLNIPLLRHFTPAVLRSVCARSGGVLRSLSIATVPLSCGAVLHALSCAPNVERLATWRGPVAMPDAYLACTSHAADAVTARLLVWAPPLFRRLLATARRLASFSGAVAGSLDALPALLSSLPADGDVRLISAHIRRGEWVRTPLLGTAPRCSPFDAPHFFSGPLRPRGSLARGLAARATAAAAAARRCASPPPPRCGRPVRRPRGQFHRGRARAGGHVYGVGQRRGRAGARRDALLLDCAARQCRHGARRITPGGAQPAQAGHPRECHEAVRGAYLSETRAFHNRYPFAGLLAPLTPLHFPSGPPPRPRLPPRCRRRRTRRWRLHAPAAPLLWLSRSPCAPPRWSATAKPCDGRAVPTVLAGFVGCSRRQFSTLSTFLFFSYKKKTEF